MRGAANEIDGKWKVSPYVVKPLQAAGQYGAHSGICSGATVEDTWSDVRTGGANYTRREKPGVFTFFALKAIFCLLGRFPLFHVFVLLVCE